MGDMSSSNAETGTTSPGAETGTTSVDSRRATGTVPPGSPEKGPGAPSPRSDGDRRSLPASKAFRDFIASGWAPRPVGLPARVDGAGPAADRRRRLSEMFPGERLVLPAGVFRVRSNDTDHRFRPHSDFAYLTGLGTDQEPDAVLVLEPAAAGEEGHEAVLFFRPRAERDREEFFANARYGELWVGERPSLEEIGALTGLRTRHLDELPEALVKGIGPEGIGARLIRETDPAVQARLEQARRAAGLPEKLREESDTQLARALSEMRLVKDSWEQDQLRKAIAVTVHGFEDIVRALPAAVGERGERVIETAFDTRARIEGNNVGYDTIAAAGPHACILHWIRNDGAVRAEDLVLIDAGIEVDTLYTADLTRTLPVSGRFSEPQRRVYQAVLDTADAAFAAVRPGAKFSDVHQAAMRVIADRLGGWGLLPCPAEDSLKEEGQFHRRWMVHGTSHHLGLDVHDCAGARRELYQEGVLREGMVFTIEPGLYFAADDLLVPEELRGIGVRIEDNVLVTADGHENLSVALPRRPDDVERWMADLSA
jgi:Xaa-Pro aminopeptidase